MRVKILTKDGLRVDWDNVVSITDDLSTIAIKRAGDSEYKHLFKRVIVHMEVVL